MRCSTIVYTKSGNLNEGPEAEEQSLHCEVRPLKGNSPMKPGASFASEIPSEVSVECPTAISLIL